MAKQSASEAMVLGPPLDGFEPRQLWFAVSNRTKTD